MAEARKLEVGKQPDSLIRQEIVKYVDELYEYRDLYFERNGIEKACCKSQDVTRKMNEVLMLIEDEENHKNLRNKAEYYMLKGKCLNVTSTYQCKSEEALSKAVKLDPKLVDAWNQLGECYWKKGDITSAKNCFTGALNHSRNKVSLRNLSMVLRQFGKTSEEKFKFIEESVSKAKEAVQLDIQDGTSWFILGNAYLSLFFAGPQNSATLKLCMKAYLHASKDPLAKNNPDLHFNRSMSSMYQGDFSDALEGFTRAKDLDPSWDEPKSKVSLLQKFLKSVEHMTLTKNNLAGKNKMQRILADLTPSDLGPYGGGSYTSANGKSVKLEFNVIRELKSGSNSNTVICGKVIGSLSSDPSIPYTFVIVDKEEACIAVSLYNVSCGYGVNTGDSVAIPEPFVMSLSVQLRDEGDGEKLPIAYDYIRVETPLILVINGKKLGIDKQAPAVLRVTAQSE